MAARRRPGLERRPRIIAAVLAFLIPWLALASLIAVFNHVWLLMIIPVALLTVGYTVVSAIAKRLYAPVYGVLASFLVIVAFCGEFVAAAYVTSEWKIDIDLYLAVATAVGMLVAVAILAAAYRLSPRR